MPALTAAQWIDLAVNFVLPAMVAVITSANAHPGLKATVLFVLSALSGALTSALQAANTGHPLTWNSVGTTVLIGFAVAILSHFGVLEPMNITGSGGRIAVRIPSGLGASTAAGKHEK